MRPTQAIINLEAIRHNINQIHSLLAPSTHLTAVVKANAYGHGAIPVSIAALQAGVSSLAVAIPEEGIELREAGIKAPIFVLGLTLPEQSSLLLEYDLIATVCTKEPLQVLSQLARKHATKAKIMIKVDTGMSRIGISPANVSELLEAAISMPEIELCGIYTHLATADAYDKTYANYQLNLFNTAIHGLSATNLPFYISAANSAAIIDLNSSHFNTVRLGIAMYGLPPSAEMHRHINLLPAMQLKTKVVYIKQVPADTHISYGCTYTTPHTTYAATLPLGYADGYSRLLSNKAPVLIGGKRRQLLGRVCMDQIIVDLGPECDVNIGDEAVLFGRQGDEEITVTELADLVGTINYELVCAVSARVPRIYINQRESNL